MDSFFGTAGPFLMLLILATATWYVRRQTVSLTVETIRRVNEAADLLDLHARSLERFLDDLESPTTLKRLLIEFSDVMGDREAVARFTEWASNRPFEQPVDNDEMEEFNSMMASLRFHRSDLAERFDAAVITAVAGASLRWPESAALFSYAFPRLLFTPKRDVVIAFTATHLKSGMPFSIKRSVPAMA